MCIVPRFFIICAYWNGIPLHGGRATPAAPTCATAFFGECGLRYTPCSPLSSSRERAPPLPINGVGNAPLRPLPACRGQPRQYDCLIQRFSLWSGFMALWAGIATPQQAEEIVARQYSDTTLFCCPAGVRSLSPLEKMYTRRRAATPRRGRGRYGYVSTISSSVGSSGTDTPPRHVSWHGRQSYSSAGILSASEPSMSIICLRMASLC